MYLTGNYYNYKYYATDRSMLRFHNEFVQLLDADHFLLSCYDLGSSEDDINYIAKKLKKYNLKLVVDATTEILPPTVLNWPTDNMVIYYNDTDIDNLENELEERNVELVKLPYFLKYMDYYTPIRTNEITEKRKFLYMVGKNKPERVCLLGLLSYHGLLDNAYYSFFSDSIDENFDYNRIEHYYEGSNSPGLQKECVAYGLGKINAPVILDTDVFDHGVSHAREYNADYYDAVDFVVVPETDLRNNFMFITEKVCKCIQLDKKFILLGSKGLLRFTKQQAKIHLDKDISHLTDWCDTSYDNVDNMWDRIDRIVEIIQDETK